MNLFLDNTIKIGVIIGGILAAIHFLFGVEVFRSPSNRYLAEYLNISEVSENLMSEYISENFEALSSNGRDAHDELAKEFFSVRGRDVIMIRKLRLLDRIVKCQNSYFCRIEGYEDFEDTIRRVWFTVRPFVDEVRGVRLTEDFAIDVELEAERIASSL